MKMGASPLNQKRLFEETAWFRALGVLGRTSKDQGTSLQKSGFLGFEGLGIEVSAKKTLNPKPTNHQHPPNKGR